MITLLAANYKQSLIKRMYDGGKFELTFSSFLLGSENLRFYLHSFIKLKKILEHIPVLAAILLPT